MLTRLAGESSVKVAGICRTALTVLRQPEATASEKSHGILQVTSCIGFLTWQTQELLAECSTVKQALWQLFQTRDSHCA